MAAMETAARAGEADTISGRERNFTELLSQIAVDESVELRSKERCYYAPSRVTALADWLADNQDATILAGGTDVGLWVTKQHRDLKKIVYVGHVRELREISDKAQSISVGAAVTYSEVLSLIAANYPDFGELLRRLGARQVRNLGTIGGNIANGSPIGDCPPALIALGAKLHLRSSGAKRSLPLEAFFIDYGKQDLKPGEFVERVEVPKLVSNQQFRAYKISKRFDQDIAAVCGAFRATLVDGVVDDVRICFGGMAGTPRRARSCEAALSGGPWNEAAVLDAGAALEDDYQPISDMRASAQYRMLVAKKLLLKFYVETSDPTSSTRVLVV
jgi:xanthine dehydrogenase small subunit